MGGLKNGNLQSKLSHGQESASAFCKIFSYRQENRQEIS